jgi:hypothetical protein
VPLVIRTGCLRWSGGLPTGSSVIQAKGLHLDQDPPIPLPRKAPDDLPGGGRVRVMGVESEQLTAEQMTDAVRALSRLIAHYVANRHDGPKISTEVAPSKARTA